MVKTKRAAGLGLVILRHCRRPRGASTSRPSFYLPFDLGELFVLGYVLVIADSGLVGFPWNQAVWSGAERQQD